MEGRHASFHGDTLRFLNGGGEMGQRIRAFDWIATPLGQPGSWPQALKTLVNLLLTSKQPMFLGWGPDRTWLYNDAFIPILGRKHPIVLGQPSMEVWAEARAALEPLFDRVFAGEPVSIPDFSLGLDRQGQIEEAHFEFAYTPVCGEDGSIDGLFGACIETTARVMAEYRQAEEIERQRQLLQQMPGFVAVLSGSKHVFEYVNDAYIAISGGRQMIGLSVRAAFPELEGQGFYELLDQVYATGQSYLAGGIPIRLAGNEESRYIDLLYAPIRDERSEVRGIFVGGYDVTERKRIEIALQKSNETLERRVAQRTADLENIRTFYTHSSECHAILALREDGRFQYDEINPATLRLYGMTRDQVIGRTIDEIFDASLASELNRHLTEALRQGSPYRYLRKQAEATVEAIATPIPAEPGRLGRLAVTARDITGQKALEGQLRQAQKMEAVGQLTGGIAHDFNNLLQGIIGSLDRAQHRIAQGRPQDADRFLKAAVESANRAASLTQRLLAFSRRQTLDPRPTDVNRLVAGMEDLIRRTMGPQVNVAVVGAVGLWQVRVDGSQLENSLLNLCINARDAMPGGGRLTIETANKWMDEQAARERELPAGQYISLCVTDTGSGMGPEVTARAFDPFFTTKPMGQGTGLGLSMVYGFVRQSGGQVRVCSEVGEGTTMCLYLPRYTGTAQEIGETHSTNEVEFGSGEVVLVVDDEVTVRMLITEVLAEAGYRVIEASEGPGALRILQSDARIDLVITDVGLPGGINGRQVADAARVLRNDLKILFITGFAENAAVGNGHLDTGMEILTKPFAMTTLESKVREMLEG
jgi:PAS domain S-box-containing protein